MSTTTDPRAKLEELTARRDAANVELDQLVSRAAESLSPGERTRTVDLGRALQKIDEEMFEARRNIDRSKLDNHVAGNYAVEDSTTRDSFNVNRGRGPAAIDRSAWDVDLGRLGPDDTVERAHRVLGAVETSGSVPAEGFEKVSEMLTGVEATRAANWAIAASDPAYASAFARLVQDPTRGHLEWTEVERAAYARTTNIARAMNLTDANGGFMVPFTLDPAIMLTNAGSNNPLRQLARVVTTTTNSWNGITSAGATSEWKAEEAEAADGSPELAQPSIPVFLGDSFVPYSFEYGQDAAGALEELSRILVDSADNLMATAYTTGNGTSAPQGIVTGLMGTASEINGAGSEVIAAADAYTLQNALPARFSANATWQSHIATRNTFAQFETTNGALAFPELRDNPPRLIGKPWYENSNMDGVINAAATETNPVLIYGSIRDAMVIVDRIGTTLELIPNLVGANQRPTGQRGALLWFRTGSEVVNIAAARILDVPSTA